MSDDVSDKVVPVTITVLGKEFQIACLENEYDSLIDSAHYLDNKMIETRDHARITGIDRIAIITALNISHELLNEQAHNAREHGGPAVDQKLIELQDKIDQILDQADI